MWTTQTIGGHACEWFEPSAPNPHGYTVLYLHGVHLQKLGDQPPFTEQFERFGLRVIGPRCGPTWWTNRVSSLFDPDVSPEAYLLQQVLPWLQQHGGIEPPRIALLGTSMGGQGALRLAYRYPDRFPIVAAIAPAIDFQHRWAAGDPALQEMYRDAEAARQETALLYIHPLNWPRHQFFCCDPTDERWWESSDRLQMKLYSLGVPHQCDLETSGGGHGFAYYNLMAERSVRFLFEHLEQERARLPLA